MRKNKKKLVLNLVYYFPLFLLEAYATISGMYNIKGNMIINHQNPTLDSIKPITTDIKDDITSPAPKELRLPIKMSRTPTDTDTINSCFLSTFTTFIDFFT